MERNKKTLAAATTASAAGKRHNLVIEFDCVVDILSHLNLNKKA